MKRKGKISKLLLKNYLVLYCLTTITFIICFAMILFFIKNDSDRTVNNLNKTLQIMEDDYRKIDASDIIKLGGFIEILDNDLNVIYRKGNVEKYRKNYNKNEFFSLISEDNEIEHNKYKYKYMIEYNDRKAFFLVKALPMDSYNKLINGISDIDTLYIISIAALFYIIISVLSIYFYSKLTAKTFLNPLYILRDGAIKIASGNYSARITLDLDNEFGELTDTFNMMAEKIDSDIIKRISKEKKLASKATIDELTAIYNRSAGMQILKDNFKVAKYMEIPLSICFLDLDELKHINDTFGHAQGDNYIKTAVAIIKNQIREKDVFIRLGGDEFLLIFINTRYEEAEKIWLRIKKSIIKFNEENGYTLSISHGIETFYKNNFNSVNNFLNCADMKMYEDKKKFKLNRKKKKTV
ncbi:diguanylate cyclase [Clostridium sp. MSJ-11]|uniref:Diguanylate cyclase n=1 Tax=Clostridium mobile TaxID=2841512 RepID=A0ABS6EJ78_9CLOT|nr:diguanylate cyclase [Clostridium mobile]MBU5484736.1 diguanylate cyclase [Clostridium mobile]